jgi:uncharacterized repeat protein (TIGR01451 family)
MKKFYSITYCAFICCLLFATISLKAQNAPCYVVTGIPYSPDSLTNPIASGVTNDDAWSGIINIGFPFCFFGNYYSQCLIGSNGSISFNIINANGYQTWPINNAFPSAIPSDLQNTISLPWEDLYPPAGGTIKYQLIGSAPYRRFVVEYKNIPMMSCTNLQFTGQVMLYESSNYIETHIANKPLCPPWNNGGAIHAIQNRFGTVASVVPSRNALQWTTANEGVRWTPICQCPTQAMPNVISGKVYRDDNSNCIQDSGEPGLFNRILRVGPWPYYVTTDTAGYYVIHVDTGSFTVHSIPETFYSQLCPSNDYSISFNSSPMTFTGNFADTLRQCHDIAVAVGGSWPRPCSTATTLIQICNYGPLPATNVQLTLELPDSTTLVSPLNYIANPSYNVYIYTWDTIQPNQCINMNVLYMVDCNVDTGTVICFSALVMADSTDCDFENNYGHACVTVRNSFDPNEKRVASFNFDANGYITNESITALDTLNYMINFQNTGTDTAYNVIVVDTISPYLDLGTVRIISSTHPCTMTATGNALVFTFNNIMLPDSNVDEPGSHGSIRYKINQRPGNMPGTVIYNNASIYFDINLPVFTNQTVNIIPSGTTGIPTPSSSLFSIYPNPANNILTVNITEKGRAEVRVFNLLGDVVYLARVETGESNLNISGFASGIYFIEVSVGNKISRLRFVKQ